MAKIDVNQPHSLQMDELKKRMEKVKEELTAKYGLSFEWAGDQELKVSGKGVKGNISLQAGEVKVHLDLSMLLTPMKGTIERKLKDQLGEQLR